MRPWKTRHGRRDRRPSGWLQWGHGDEAVEDLVDAGGMGCYRWLQWGHGDEAVEDLSPAGGRGWRNLLQWGHGDEAVEDEPVRL